MDPRLKTAQVQDLLKLPNCTKNIPSRYRNPVWSCNPSRPTVDVSLDHVSSPFLAGIQVTPRRHRIIVMSCTILWAYYSTVALAIGVHCERGALARGEFPDLRCVVELGDRLPIPPGLYCREAYHELLYRTTLL